NGDQGLLNHLEPERVQHIVLFPDPDDDKASLWGLTVPRLHDRRQESYDAPLVMLLPIAVLKGLACRRGVPVRLHSNIAAFKCDVGTGAHLRPVASPEGLLQSLVLLKGVSAMRGVCTRSGERETKSQKVHPVGMGPSYVSHLLVCQGRIVPSRPC